MEEKKKELEIVQSLEEEQKKEESRQTSSLTGFIFALLSWTQGFGLFGLAFAIVGLICSIKGDKVKSPNHKSLKTVARVLSIIELVLYVVIPLIIFCIAIVIAVIYGIIVVGTIIIGGIVSAAGSLASYTY